MLQKTIQRKTEAHKWKQLLTEIKEAKEDPQFRKELKQFIKITTS